jgi:hypothetical protein
MATIAIKTTKPFTEHKVQATGGIKDNILIGIKAYSESELAKVRKNFQEILNTTKVERWLKELTLVKEDLTLSYEELDAKTDFLTSSVEEATDKRIRDMDTFYKSHILYIKNASLTIDDKGKVSDLLISDTRDAKQIDSLWDDGDECLVVLLNIYLDNPSFRESLQTVVTNAVFNIDLKGEELKN